MSRRHVLAIAIFWIANHHQMTLAQGQKSAEIRSTPCPAPHELTARHLWGRWEARFDGLPGTATVQLTRDAQHPDGLGGEITRAAPLSPARALVAGDIDDGDFTLEESEDGKHIAASWSGRPTEDTCGQEIRGSWTHASHPTPRGFVLRRLPGWH